MERGTEWRSFISERLVKKEEEEEARKRKTGEAGLLEEKEGI